MQLEIGSTPYTCGERSEDRNPCVEWGIGDSSADEVRYVAYLSAVVLVIGDAIGLLLTQPGHACWAFSTMSYC